MRLRNVLEVGGSPGWLRALERQVKGDARARANRGRLLQEFGGEAGAPLRAVLAFLERQWVWPASAGEHGSYPGGLYQHTLEVGCRALLRARGEPGPVRLAAALAGLGHDLGKVAAWRLLGAQADDPGWGLGHPVPLGRWVRRQQFREAADLRFRVTPVFADHAELSLVLLGATCGRAVLRDAPPWEPWGCLARAIATHHRDDDGTRTAVAQWLYEIDRSSAEQGGLRGAEHIAAAFHRDFQALRLAQQVRLGDARDPRCLGFDDQDRGRLLLILPKVLEAIRRYRLERGEGTGYDRAGLEGALRACGLLGGGEGQGGPTVLFKQEGRVYTVWPVHRRWLAGPGDLPDRVPEAALRRGPEALPGI